MKQLPISQWLESEKPREKLQILGKTGLNDAELLGIILSTGARVFESNGSLISKSAIDLANDLLDLAGGSLALLSQLSLEELTQIKGVGPAKAIKIMAALELGNRKHREHYTEQINMVCSSKSAYSLFRNDLQDLPVEHFWVALLNKANKIIKKFLLSQGGLNGTVADPAIIVKKAVLHNARGVILCHNHPSGQLSPSVQDINLTHKVKQGLAFLDIQLLDHIIIASHGYLSFADDGLLN